MAHEVSFCAIFRSFIGELCNGHTKLRPPIELDAFLELVSVCAASLQLAVCSFRTFFSSSSLADLMRASEHHTHALSLSLTSAWPKRRFKTAENSSTPKLGEN